MSDEDDEVGKGVNEAIGVTLSVSLAMMFTQDDKVEESAKIISAGIFTLVKSCGDPHQAIGIALACALGSALIGGSVEELTDMTRAMADDSEHFESMRKAFHELIDSIKQDEEPDMGFAKPGDSVH